MVSSIQISLMVSFVCLIQATPMGREQKLLLHLLKALQMS